MIPITYHLSTLSAGMLDVPIFLPEVHGLKPAKGHFPLQSTFFWVYCNIFWYCKILSSKEKFKIFSLFYLFFSKRTRDLLKKPNKLNQT